MIPPTVPRPPARPRHPAWPALAWLLLALALAAQIALGSKLRDREPGWTGVPAPPRPAAARALAGGDSQLFYRGGILALQHMGDTGGRVTPLTRYDYGRVVAWLELLERFDPRASAGPALAAGYFGQSPRPEQVAHIARYLARRAEARPRHNWPWLLRALALARHGARSPALTAELAARLAGLAQTHPTIAAELRARRGAGATGLRARPGD